ncbi:MAG: class I SAM-dependent methyltransferase [Actinomycetota bacterium]
MEDRPAEAWAVGEAYESYVGRWSRPVAGTFVAWLGVGPGRRWLDVGCGTGGLTSTILEYAAPAGVEAVDPSEGFLRAARRRIGDARVAFQSGDALALPVADGSVDAAVSGLLLNFVPDPSAAMAEAVRVTRPGGTVAAYVWDYAEGMQLMRLFWDAAVALDPAAGALDEDARFPLCRPETLRALFSAAGLAGVDVRSIDVATRFRDFDDYWTPFLGGQGPAPGYAMSLDEPRRAALRERLRAALPTGPDGSIRLVARAWAVRGTPP